MSPHAPREAILVRKLILGSLFASALFAAPLLSSAGQLRANEKEMAPLQYLVGTWHCDWQSGSKSGSEDQIFQTALDGAWLEEQEVVSVNGRQTVKSIHYTGYDPRDKAYIHIGPDANGSYEIAHSRDSEVWQSTDGSFVHQKISDSQRKMTETYGSGNAIVQLSMTCAKTNL